MSVIFTKKILTKILQLIFLMILIWIFLNKYEIFVIVR
jgi:hypothetical protein